jgi:hypothetical protein
LNKVPTFDEIRNGELVLAVKHVGHFTIFFFAEELLLLPISRNVSRSRNEVLLFRFDFFYLRVVVDGMVVTVVDFHFD